MRLNHIHIYTKYNRQFLGFLVHIKYNMVNTQSIICFKSAKLIYPCKNVYPLRIFWNCVTQKFLFHWYITQPYEKPIYSIFSTLIPIYTVLAWRIPGMGKPGRLLSMGSHRVGHDWSDLAAAAGVRTGFLFFSFFFG